MRRLLGLALAGLTLLRAQDAATDPAALEQQLRTTAAKSMLAIADALSMQRQHLRALTIRREVLLEYSPDDPAVRDKCGYVKVGEGWRRDEAKLVIEKDLKGEPKLLKKIDQDQDKLLKELGKEHQKVAEAFARKGDVDSAMRHWRRVLRFRPGDKQASAELRMHEFDGYHGGEKELGMLRRSRAIRGAVEYLKQKQFPMRSLDDEKHPLLEKAGIAHQGVATEHFRAHGAIPVSQLQQAVQYAERSLLLARTLFGTSQGHVFTPKRQLDMLFLGDRPTYARTVDACQDQFEPDRLEFLKELVDLAFLKVGNATVRAYCVDGGEEEVLDMTVRGVMNDATNYGAEGLWEGIGHAACGFFFEKTITFLVEQQKAHTVTSWQPKPLLPDMETWRQIAAESAWAKSDTPTSVLVLISAAKFETEQRVKAWAIADYLLRWRPELVMELDQSRGEKIHTPPEVENEFQRRTGLDLRRIDDDWRDFWARQAELRKAMVAEPGGGKDEVAGARALAFALDDVRAAARQGPIGFYVSQHPEVKVVHKYWDDLARAESEQKKEAKKQGPKVEIAMPVPPACLGRSVFAFRGAEPAAAVVQWLDQPGARDLLLHPGRLLVGCSKGKHGFVLDVTEPAVPARGGVPSCWPRAGQRDVPAATTVAALGPEFGAALAQAGRKPEDRIGTPISLHFWRELTAEQVGEVQCTVDVEGAAVAGVGLCIQGDGTAAAAAPGCCLFVPLDPLPAGKDVTVAWTLPKGTLAKDEVFAPVTFTVK
jgi:tetratricopeptide (TPR) repeat protein